MSIEVTGLDDAVRMLEGVRTRVLAPAPALESWAAHVEELVQTSAASGITPEGARWAPRKAALGRTRRPTGRAGVLTGAMLASITTSVSARSVSLFVLAPYARFFATGSRRRGIPSRRILPSSTRGPYGAAFAAFVESLADYSVRGGRGR